MIALGDLEAFASRSPFFTVRIWMDKNHRAENNIRFTAIRHPYMCLAILSSNNISPSAYLSVPVQQNNLSHMCRPVPLQQYVSCWSLSYILAEAPLFITVDKKGTAAAARKTRHIPSRIKSVFKTTNTMRCSLSYTCKSVHL